MPYLLDSDLVIDHLAGSREAMVLIEGLVPDGVAASVISYMESFQGIQRSPNLAQAQASFTTFSDTVPVIPVTVPVAERCALLRDQLQREGKRVRARALDLLIAATAIEYGLMLVTRNQDDFRDIPGLQLHQL